MLHSVQHDKVAAPRSIRRLHKLDFNLSKTMVSDLFSEMFIRMKPDKGDRIAANHIEGQ